MSRARYIDYILYFEHPIFRDKENYFANNLLIYYIGKLRGNKDGKCSVFIPRKYCLILLRVGKNKIDLRS